MSIGPFSLRRGADMLHLDVVLNGLTIDEAGVLQAVDVENSPGTAVFTLPPQSVLEQVFTEDEEPIPGAVGARLAGSSQLEFEVPGETPATLEGLLSWSGLTLLPDVEVTSVEAPWGLLLVPEEDQYLSGQPAPVTRDGRTELWHSRLHSAPDSDGPPRVQVASNRESKDPVPDPNDPDPIRPVGPISAGDRDNLVAASKQAAVAADLFMVTSLGASLDLAGDWPAPATLESWRHRSTLGRDHAVRIVTRGFLFPFGHRAVLISITRRQIVDGHAHLERRAVVVVRQPVLDYDAVEETGGERKNPLRSIELLTLVTPTLAQQHSTLAGIPAFWIQQRHDVLFEVRATDARGNQVSFRLPLIFVPAPPGDMSSLVEYYNNLSSPEEELPRRTANFAAASLDVTSSREPAPKSSRETTFPVSSVVFGANVVSVPQSDPPLAPFQPILQSIDAVMPAVAALTGAKPTVMTLVYTDRYVKHGFDATENPGEVFAVPTSAGQPLAFGSAEHSGGLALPTMSINALSRAVGPVSGDAETFAKGTFEPGRYFSADAKLLGTIPLMEVIAKAPFGPDDARAGRAAPRMVTEDGRTVLRWSAPVVEYKGLFVPRAGSALELSVVQSAPADGVPAGELSGSLGNFSLRFPPSPGDSGSHLIELQFSRLSFLARDGAKPDIDLTFADVHFVNDLSFVDRFKDVIQQLGGFGVEATPQAIVAQTSIAIPAIEVGVFGLRNLSFGATAELPFHDSPVGMDLEFSRRDAPFLMTISVLGGSGYFMTRLTAERVKSMELSLGVGAAVSFGIAGIASGSVSIVAGFILSFDQTTMPAVTKLGGFLRISGALEVLGLVTLGVELSMTLLYQPTGKVIGHAQLKLKIKIAFFSKSISAGVERRFGGSGDPTVAEMLTQSDWDEYCDAFAPEGSA